MTLGHLAETVSNDGQTQTTGMLEVIPGWKVWPVLRIALSVRRDHDGFRMVGVLGRNAQNAFIDLA